MCYYYEVVTHISVCVLGHHWLRLSHIRRQAITRNQCWLITSKANNSKSLYIHESSEYNLEIVICDVAAIVIEGVMTELIESDLRLYPSVKTSSLLKPSFSGLDNGLSSVRRQAIMLTPQNTVHWNFIENRKL